MGKFVLSTDPDYKERKKQMPEQKTEYPSRTKVKVSEVTGPFLVERIGREWNGGNFGPSYPLDITLQDGTLAVMWVNGNSVCGRQVKEGEVTANTAYEIFTATAKKSNNEYRAFREAE